MRLRFSAVVLILMTISISAMNVAQEVRSRRQAYGVKRAEEVEALLRRLYPNAVIEWDPVLAIRQGSGAPEPVDMGNFVTRHEPDGSVLGVTALEVGRAKNDRLEKLKNFRASEIPTFTTMMIAFQMPRSGQPLDIKKVLLDPYDPLSRVTWFEVRNWPAGGWPELRLRYESYKISSNAVTVIEWDSVFDMTSGTFLARLPSGILTYRKYGDPNQEILSFHRTGPREIEIVGGVGKKELTYPCGDPCVVDGDAFLAQWPE